MSRVVQRLTDFHPERVDFMERFYKKLTKTIVPYKEIETYNPAGEGTEIKAITYDGLLYRGKKTKVFAYLGIPGNAKEKVPGIVLVHGGGGVPFASWVKMWNDRGYAAIAMSVTGDFPLTADTMPYKEEHGKHREVWQYGMHGEFIEDGYLDAPGNDQMANSEKDISEQWMYHALGQVIFAHNILRSDEHVDSDKVGITGISWGGVIASLAIGYDDRFSFAIPVYGSGHLAESMGRLGTYFRSGNNPKLWLAEKNFDKVTIPILWLCWNEDWPFSLNSNSDSYRDTVKNNEDTRLSAIHEMKHAHWNGWGRAESFAFADSVCKKSPKLPRYDVSEGKIINPDGVNIKGIKLYYLENPLSYIDDENGIRIAENWKICQIESAPVNAANCYYEITSEIDGKEYITTSEIIEQK